MARKANKKTSNKWLIDDILSDQASMVIQHHSHGKARRERLCHNIKELYRRLGETVGENDMLYYG